MRHWPSPALTAIYLLLPVLQAETIQMKAEVWGYVGQEVILPCDYDPGPSNGGVSQVQWELKATNSAEQHKLLIVHAVSSGLTHTNDEYLDKLALKEYSLVIKNVNVEDAGVYVCDLATFPSGTLSGQTTLFISDQMPLSAGAVSGIVISVFLLLGIIAASVYFIVIRRRRSSHRNQVTVDTDGWDPSRPSFIKRDDVVYTDVAVRQPSNQNHVNSSEDHVTYSEVRVNRTEPEEPLYAQVMRI